jgi:hypothetical protein
MAQRKHSKQRVAKLRMPEVGPTSLEGVEASDFPDKGRGSVDENIGKTLRRKTPDKIGGSPQETGGDVGMRAMPGSADADDHGSRKHN